MSNYYCNGNIQNMFRKLVYSILVSVSFILLSFLCGMQAYAVEMPLYIGDNAYPVKQSILILDEDNSGGDLSLQFGRTLAENLKWDADGGDGSGWFDFSHSFRVYENSAGVGTGTGITIENDGTGDSILQFLLTGVQRWVIGIDNSDGDKLKIATSSDLNSDSVISIDTSGNIGIGKTSPDFILDSISEIQIGDGTDTDQDFLILNNGADIIDRPRLSWEKGVFFSGLDGVVISNPDGPMTLLANSANDYAYLLANSQNNGREVEILISHNTDPTTYTNLYAHAVGLAPTTQNPYLAFQRAATAVHYLDVTTSGAAITEVVFNEASNDQDLRIEGNSQANLFFVDAGNDRIGIGNNAPDVALDVTGTVQISNAYLFLYKNASQDLGSSWTDITWDNEVREDSLYSHTSGSEEFSVTEDGWYLIIAECAAELGSGTSRSNAEWRLSLNEGGGYSEIAGTRSGTYHRTDGDDQGAMTIHRLIELNNGDLVKLQGMDDGNDVQTMVNGCRFFVERK